MCVHTCKTHPSVLKWHGLGLPVRRLRAVCFSRVQDRVRGISDTQELVSMVQILSVTQCSPCCPLYMYQSLRHQVLQRTLFVNSHTRKEELPSCKYVSLRIGVGAFMWPEVWRDVTGVVSLKTLTSRGQRVTSTGPSQGVVVVSILEDRQQSTYASLLPFSVSSKTWYHHHLSPIG